MNRNIHVYIAINGNESNETSGILICLFHLQINKRANGISSASLLSKSKRIMNSAH